MIKTYISSLQNHEIEKIKKTKYTGENETQAAQIREATIKKAGVFEFLCF